MYKTVYNWDKIASLEAINVTLMEHSYFYTRLREKFLTIRKKNIDEYYSDNGRKGVRGAIRKEGEKYDARSKEEIDNTLSLFINRYKKALEDIAMIAKARHIKLIFIVPPYPTFNKKPDEDIATPTIFQHCF